ncbi:MAG: 2-hydroxyacyl-CoA dehydratase family protein [Chloroflexota bacterium]|nr:2-hydroxyacyl-CoA dehydratase family protein [Chloroflexota bacterium]
MAEEALAKVDKICQERDSRAKELKGEGKKVVGYFCAYVPAEILTAAGLVPYRITGNINEPISKADAYVETIMCPFVRNCFDKAIRGEYSFLNGFIVPHSCDNVVKIYDIWKYNLKPEYSHFLNVPHTTTKASMEFFKAELGTFKKSIEDLVGREISSGELNDAIKLHNEQRALIKELYEFRKQDPPLISGSEVMKTMVAISKIPVQDSNDLLKGVISDIKGRSSSPFAKLPRLMIYGPEIDDVPFIEMVEETGANVVIDDICLGTKSHWWDVEITPDPLDGIAEAYLDKINCSRTYRQRWGTRDEDLDSRFGYLRRFAQDYNVNGVFLYIIKYCDNYEFDAIDIKDYLEKAGFPGLVVEGDYTAMSIEWLKTRVQAFLEMVS